MNFHSLNEFVATQSVSMPHFDFLHPDENIYRCLVMQPRSDVTASTTGVAAHALNDRCAAFWDLAQRSKVDLAATPEYSFSWVVLESKIRNGCLPAKGKLWVLGMQSITPAELDDMRGRLTGARTIYDRPWEAGRQGTFLDAACFVFTSKEGTPVVAVQFKQYHMATGPEPLERNHMIHGRHGYYVENDERSVRLACLICADALSFAPKADLPLFPGRSYLLLHLQLNPHPRQAAFSEYRCCIFDCNTDSVEVLCLNWAAGTTITLPHAAPTRLGFPHSGFYWKAPGLSLHDRNLLANHDGSAYYFYWQQRRTHLNVLHDAEHCLLCDATKPSQILGPAASSTRSGIQNPTPLDWHNGIWTHGHLDDGCTSLITRTAQTTQQVLNDLNRLELERFVAVCCGAVDGVEWHRPTSLPLFRLGEDERHQRVGFCRDPASLPQAAEKLALVGTLVSQFQSTIVASGRHAYLLQGTTIGHSVANRACNVHRNDGPYATAAYVGTDLGGVRAAQARDALRTIFPGDGNPLIFVWYTENGAFEYISTAGEADITSGPSERASIV